MNDYLNLNVHPYRLMIAPFKSQVFGFHLINRNIGRNHKKIDDGRWGFAFLINLVDIPVGRDFRVKNPLPSIREKTGFYSGYRLFCAISPVLKTPGQQFTGYLIPGSGSSRHR